MKEVKELADLVAMQPIERDAWFAERLFGYIWRHDNKERKLVEKNDEFYFRFQKCGENDLLLPMCDDYYNEVRYITTTNDGTADLKAEMVKLGYKWECQCDGRKYWFVFRKVTRIFTYECDTEIEATWKSAALALLGEV